MEKITKNFSSMILQKTEGIETGKAGLIWIYHSMKEFGLKKIIENKFRVKKSNNQISEYEKIMSVALMLINGGNAIEDIEVLRADKGLIKGLGIKKIITGDTILNFFNIKKTGEKIKSINEELAVKAMKKTKADNFIYDNDATYFNSKKKCANYSYKKEKQMSGLLGFLPKLGGICITADYRKGNISPSEGIIEQLKQAVKLARKAGKVIGIFRSDSAAHKYEIIKYCRDKAIKFYISIRKNKGIQEIIKSIAKKEWKTVKNQVGKEYVESIHVTNDITIRILILRWRKTETQLNLFEDNEYNYHVIGTNDEEIEAKEWLEFHNGRMGSENYNKELKNGLAIEYMPSHDFNKNKAYFMINILAYNIIQIMKYFYLDNKENWNIKTLQNKFINNCCKFIRHARKVVCKIINVTDEATRK